MGASIYLWEDDWPIPGGNRLGFEIYEEDENGVLNRVGDTLYVDNLTRGDWNYIDLSDYNFFTDGDFYISTMQDDIGDFVPGTGLDTDSPHGSRSYLNLAGEMEPLASAGLDGALMIRAHMDYTQSPPETELAKMSKVSTNTAKTVSAKADKSVTNLKSEEVIKVDSQTLE